MLGLFYFSQALFHNPTYIHTYMYILCPLDRVDYRTRLDCMHHARSRLLVPSQISQGHTLSAIRTYASACAHAGTFPSTLKSTFRLNFINIRLTRILRLKPREPQNQKLWTKPRYPRAIPIFSNIFRNTLQIVSRMRTSQQGGSFLSRARKMCAMSQVQSWNGITA